MKSFAPNSRLSLAIFNLLAYLVPTFSGSFTSLPRYVLVCFPSFVVIAVILKNHPRLRFAVYLTSVISLAYFWMKFSQGYWVG